MAGKEHVTFAFMRGAALPDPEKLLEGTGKGVRHVKLRSVADVKRPGVKKLIAEAAKLNKKDPPSGVMVGMEKRKRKTNCRDWRNQSEGDSSCRRQAITRNPPAGILNVMEKPQLMFHGSNECLPRSESRRPRAPKH